MSSPLTFKWLGWHGNNDAENMCVSSAYCCYSKESPFFCIYLLFPSSSSVASYFCSLLDKQLDWKPFVFLFPPPLQYYCLLGSVPRVEKIIIRAPVFILFLKKERKKIKTTWNMTSHFSWLSPRWSLNTSRDVSLSRLSNWHNGADSRRRKRRRKSPFFLFQLGLPFVS